MLYKHDTSVSTSEKDTAQPCPFPKLRERSECCFDYYLILILLRTSQTAICIEIYTANDRAPKDLYKACDDQGNIFHTISAQGIVICYTHKCTQITTQVNPGLGKPSLSFKLPGHQQHSHVCCSDSNPGLLHEKPES